MLNEHNTVFARSGPLYTTGVFLGPPESSTQTTSLSLQLFLQGSLDDRPTDHATRSVTIGGSHSWEAKFCYCLRLQGVSLGPPKSSTQTASRLLQPFLQALLGDRPTDRRTDHAIRAVIAREFSQLTASFSASCTVVNTLSNVVSGQQFSNPM